MSWARWGSSQTCGSWAPLPPWSWSSASSSAWSWWLAPIGSSLIVSVGTRSPTLRMRAAGAASFISFSIHGSRPRPTMTPSFDFATVSMSRGVGSNECSFRPGWMSSITSASGPRRGARVVDREDRDGDLRAAFARGFAAARAPGRTTTSRRSATYMTYACVRAIARRASRQAPARTSGVRRAAVPQREACVGRYAAPRQGAPRDRRSTKRAHERRSRGAPRVVEGASFPLPEPPE